MGHLAVDQSIPLRGQSIRQVLSSIRAGPRGLKLWNLLRNARRIVGIAPICVELRFGGCSREWDTILFAARNEMLLSLWCSKEQRSRRSRRSRKFSCWCDCGERVDRREWKGKKSAGRRLAATATDGMLCRRALIRAEIRRPAGVTHFDLTTPWLATCGSGFASSGWLTCRSAGRACG